MKKVVVSAPGKIHLSGEHSVVHGKPAVLVSVSKRMYITLTTQESERRTQSDIANIKNKNDYLTNIIKLVEKNYQVEFAGFSLTINSDIPIGAGMGSSAALAVSVIAALRQWINKQWNTAEINELAFQAEKFQHGNPSGGDNTIVTNGGILWYRKELDFLKTFWLLPFKIPKSFSPIVLINTGRTETTGELVKLVAELNKKDKKAFTLLISQIEDITRNLTKAIHDENEKLFKENIYENEKLLEEIGVVSNIVKKMIEEIKQSGGVAKISGAGGIKTGSGIVVAIHKEAKKLITIAEKYNFPSFQVKLGGEGVKLKQVII